MVACRAHDVHVQLTCTAAPRRHVPRHVCVAAQGKHTCAPAPLLVHDMPCKTAHQSLPKDTCHVCDTCPRFKTKASRTTVGHPRIDALICRSAQSDQGRPKQGLRDSKALLCSGRPLAWPGLANTRKLDQRGPPGQQRLDRGARGS
eukprot:15453831-Alexandrium_andersonii.AAC.1